MLSAAMTPVDEFINHLKTDDKSPHTIGGYRTNLAMFARWFEKTTGQPMAPANVTPLDLQQYRRYLLANKKAPGTVNQKISYLRGFFDWSVIQGLASSNPARKIKLVQQERRSPKWLNRQQVYALLRAAQEAVQLAELRGNSHKALVTKRTAAMLALMLHAGLRVSEVCMLQRGDLVIRPRSGKVIVRRGKGRKYREVPLNVDARRAVSTWLNVWTGHTYLFDNVETGRPLHPRTVQYFMARLGRSAGLARLAPHRLRHTFGKNLVDMDVSLDRVAMLMGHASIDTTAIYTMASEEDLQKAVDLIAWSD